MTRRMDWRGEGRPHELGPVQKSGVPGHVRVLGLGLLLLLGSVSCDSTPSSTTDFGERTLLVLYTNDEHGWIEEGPETDGAAKLMGLWRSVEGYTEDGDFLILSGGDNWTGPAISTWFEGESTVDVMNAMNYSATAIGNHEFDFTVEGLRDRIAQAHFPFLSANIRLEGTDTPPDFAAPYVIKVVNGIRVGLLGLTTTSTPQTAFPTYVENYEFIPYWDALQQWVPMVRGAGADIVIVLGHFCHNEMLSVLPAARDLGVAVLTGGHCNELVGEVREGVALVVGGWKFANYGRVEIGFDDGTRAVTRLHSTTRVNTGGSPDPEVAAVVSGWRQAAEGELSEVVGYAEEPVSNGSPELYNLITDSWLFAFPNADIAMSNAGGVRQGIPAGDITRGTIVGVLPFQNSLVELDLTGTEVVDCLENGMILGGMTTVGGFFHADGTPLKMDSLYHVLTTDYLYVGDDYNFQLYDEAPYFTGINYHQPTVALIEALNTSSANPLDQFLDSTSRR